MPENSAASSKKPHLYMSAKAWICGFCILEIIDFAEMGFLLLFEVVTLIFFFFLNLFAGTLGTCMCPRTVRLLQVSIILRINPITLQQYLFFISVFPSFSVFLSDDRNRFFCVDQIWKQYLEGLIQSQDMKSGVLFLSLTFERCF